MEGSSKKYKNWQLKIMFWWYLNKEKVYNIGCGILCIIFLPVILVFGLIDDEYRENARDKGYPGDSELDVLSDIRKWNKERKRKIKEDKKAEKERMKKMKGIAFRDFCEWKNKD